MISCATKMAAPGMDILSELPGAAHLAPRHRPDEGEHM